MDATLAEVKYRPDMRTYSLIVAFLRAVLASCIVLPSVLLAGHALQAASQSIAILQ